MVIGELDGLTPAWRPTHLEIIGGHPALHEEHGLLRCVGLFCCLDFELGEGVD